MTTSTASRSSLTLGWGFSAALLVTVLASPAAFAQAADVPYVPTPMNVVEAMLTLAKVGPGDFVIDLGSGDGRIVITAAKKFGARGFGVDLDGALVSDARRDAERQGVKDRVEFHTRNIFITDIAQATVLTSYLFPQVNIQLRPRIFEQLKPGTRVVSHDFDFGNWQPDAHVRVPVRDKPYGPPMSEVYLWIVPANAAGRWQWRMPLEAAIVDCELTLEQTFQAVRGSGRIGGNAVRLEQASLRGEALGLTLIATAGGREIRHELAGRVSGDTIRGTVRASGAASTLDWNAMRVARGKINIDAAADAPRVANF
ncbi:MAG TPA: methyltransferase domain-containing protein [Burkholderiales bacterium]|nr:methyltransferase domain-containing protein [Burkholderiales bacterium]